MRRVVVVQSFWGGGSNRFLVRNLEMLRRQQALAAVAVLYPTLQRRWGDVPVVSLSDPRSHFGTLRWLMRAMLMRLGVTPKILARRPVDGLKQLLASTEAEVVLCQYATTAGLLWEALDGSGRDLFIHLHGADTHEPMCPQGHRRLVAEMARRAMLICNSRDTYDRMIGWAIPADRLVIKYPGVEVPSQPPVRESRDSVTILQLGRLVRFKGPERTIRAFERACDQGFRGRLVLAGEGPLYDECRLLISCSNHQDRIELLGAVGWEEGQRLRLESDIYTQHNVKDPETGQVEAYGVAVVEAMAEGLPVVGTRSGGVLETVVDGTTGILVEPGDESGQADAFVRLATAPADRILLGRAGWARAGEMFSVEREEVSLLRILGLADESD